MSFTSWGFLPFIAIVLPLYYVLPRRPAERDADGRELHLLWRLGLAVLGPAPGFDRVDYRLGLHSEASSDPRTRKAILYLELRPESGPARLLQVFRLFRRERDPALATLGVPVSPVHLEIVLPIGISFYTFHSLSYIIDIYRRDRSPTRHFFGLCPVRPLLPAARRRADRAAHDSDTPSSSGRGRSRPRGSKEARG